MMTSRVRRAIAVSAVATAACVSSAASQELSFLTGALEDYETREDTYSWRIEYLQGLGENLHFTWSWVNEGHVLGHHRDGHTLQLWYRRNTLGRRLSLALGGGAYRFYDTQAAETSQGYANQHGTGVNASATAGYYLRNRVVLRGQLTRIWGPSTTIDTWSGLLGVGYQLQAPRQPGPTPWANRQSERTLSNELTLFIGRTVVNSYNSEKGVAGKLAFRRGFARYFAWSIALVDEGDPDVIRRDGVTSQIWAARTFFRDEFEIGLGVGLYYAIDQKYNPESDDEGQGTLAGLVTPSICWRFAPQWSLRLDWDRTVTSYHRDTDIFGLGAGYRF